MKILFYSSNSVYSGKPVGGAESSLYRLAKGLASTDQVSYLTKPSNQRYAKSKIEKRENVQVHLLQCMSIPFQRFPLLKMLQSKLDRRILFRALSKHYSDVDWIITYSEIPDTSNILSWKKRSKIRAKQMIRVAGFHWHFDYALNSDEKKSDIAKIYESVDLVNFLSQPMRNQFFSIVKEHNYGFNIPNSFLADVLVPSSKNDQLWKRTKEPHFVMVSRFDNVQKLPLLLIESFKVAQIENSTLTFYGEGVNLLEIQKRCKSDIFLSNRVIFKGFVPFEELKKDLINYRCMCLCSNYEGLPKSILESMILGIPVLVSNIDAYIGLIEDKVNGFTVDNRVEDWAKALLSVSSLPSDQLDTISNNGREFVEKNYSYSEGVKKYRKELLKLTAD